MTAAPAPAKPKPKVSYPRPPLVHDHAALFKEPAYEGGQPYTVDDGEDDDGPDHRT